MLAHGRRSGERDFADDRRGDEIFRNVGRNAENHIQYALGQPGVVKRTRELKARVWRFLCWLDNHRTACGERSGDLARGDRGGEVPRRERSDRSDWLLDYHMPHARMFGRNDPPVSAAGFFGIPIENVGAGKSLAS